MFVSFEWWEKWETDGEHFSWVWVLVDEVVQVNLAEESQGNVILNESDIEPEKGQVAPEREVESADSVMN